MSESDGQNLVWHFDRREGWRSIPSPAEGPGYDEDISAWVRRSDYDGPYELGDDYDEAALSIYRRDDGTEGVFRYVVLVSDIYPDCFETVFVPTFPDLLALARDVYPLWQTGKTHRLHAFIEMAIDKAFRIWHGHVAEGVCSQCDPIGYERKMEQLARLRQRRAEGKA